MSRWKLRLFGSVVVAGGVVALAAAPAAGGAPKGTLAVTCELQLKHLGPLDGKSGGDGRADDRIYRQVESQGIYVRFGGRDRDERELTEFRWLAKKEPKYVSKQPIRAVATLGGKGYAFAIDQKDDKSKPWSRLYFDANGNGDLTDDPPIDAKASSSGGRAYDLSGRVSSDFPQVKVPLDVGGVKMDYAFSLQVSGRLAKDEPPYASISLEAMTYREGRIELEGKPHRLVLLDHNSNGTFDDTMEVSRDYWNGSSLRVGATQGDRLLIDPDPKAAPADRDRDGAGLGDDQQPLSKLVRIDGRYYHVQVSPAGDWLLLAPSSAPLGYVTSPHPGLSAVLYGNYGCVAVNGKSGPVPLPAGQWKLLSYTIDQTESYRAALAKEKAKQLPGKKPQTGASTDQLLGGLLESLVGPEETRRLAAQRGPRSTILSAEAQGDTPPVTVRKAETVKLPFGPPFQGVVTAFREEVPEEDLVAGPNGEVVRVKPPSALPKKEPVTVRLSLSLVGAAGEVCTNLMVDGETPPAPKFTIKTPDGRVVQTGDFEYG